MDSEGRIHMSEDISSEINRERAGRALREGETILRDRLVTRFPMPAECDPRRVLRTLEKFAGLPQLPGPGDATMFLLTPFERGYVLGILSAAPSPGTPGGEGER